LLERVGSRLLTEKVDCHFFHVVSFFGGSTCRGQMPIAVVIEVVIEVVIVEMIEGVVVVVSEVGSEFEMMT